MSTLCCNTPSHSTSYNRLRKETVCEFFKHNIELFSDWNYLCALNEVEKMNISGEQKVKERVKWIERFASEVDKYVDYTTLDVDLPDELCQACGVKKVTKVAQLFHLVDYNPETLEVIEGAESGAGSPLQAIVSQNGSFTIGFRSF